MKTRDQMLYLPFKESGMARVLKELRRRSVALALAGAALICAGTGAQAAEAVATPGDIEGVGLYGARAIVVHRQLTTHANENRAERLCIQCCAADSP